MIDRKLIQQSEFGRLILAVECLARRFFPKLGWEYDAYKSEYDNLTALLNACAEADVPTAPKAPAKKKQK